MRARVSLSIVCVLAMWASPAPGQEPPDLVLTAASANVAEPGRSVRIRIFGWSSDEQRKQLITTLTAPPPPPPADADGERGGRAASTGRGGRGGRGRGRTPAAPLTPIQALTAAIAGAPTIGFIWTSDVTGYAIKYAYRSPLPGGGERIVLATDRRFGMHTAAWQPAFEAAPTEYEFTLIEVRIGTKGIGEARTSLATTIGVDAAAGTLALDNYDAAPAILDKVALVADGG